MKKFVFVLAILMIGATSFAQTAAATVDTAAHKVKVKQVQNPAAWACPTCFKITKGGGMCPDDKTAMVQLGTYYCAHCVKATGAKPGKCPSCGGATTQMTRRLCTEHAAASVKKAA